jgi:hypothetical protein
VPAVPPKSRGEEYAEYLKSPEWKALDARAMLAGLAQKFSTRGAG